MYLRAAVCLLPVLAAAPWWSAETLRESFPPDSKPVAYWRAPDAAFLACAVTGKSVHSIVRFDGGRAELRFDGAISGSKGTDIDSLDLLGRRVGQYVVLFHTESGLARSALSFDTGRHASRLTFIVTGLAPGIWEVWRNGWVVDIGVPVRAGEAVLYFEGDAGSYFIRRLQ